MDKKIILGAGLLGVAAWLYFNRQQPSQDATGGMAGGDSGLFSTGATGEGGGSTLAGAPAPTFVFSPPVSEQPPQPQSFDFSQLLGEDNPDVGTSKKAARADYNTETGVYTNPNTGLSYSTATPPEKPFLGLLNPNFGAGASEAKKPFLDLTSANSSINESKKAAIVNYGVFDIDAIKASPYYSPSGTSTKINELGSVLKANPGSAIGTGYDAQGNAVPVAVVPSAGGYSVVTGSGGGGSSKKTASGGMGAGGTYNAATGVYISPSGLGYSTATPPAAKPVYVFGKK